jgi:hypothetical protein
MKKFTLLFVFMIGASVIFAQAPTIHLSGINKTITNEQIQQLGQHQSDNPSNIIVLNFEGLGDVDAVNQFYNGGTSGLGFSGVNYGVYFSPNGLGVIDIDAGGTGNIANEPSPSTVLFFLEGNATIMNVAAGFTTGFSFFYSANVGVGSVSVYDGLDGTGNLLGSQILPINYQNGGCTGDPNGDFCHWDAVGISFAGTAKSISFGGVANHVAFDDVTFGSILPGCAIPTLSQWGLIILALLFLAAEMVYIRRRQYSFATAGGEVSETRKSLFNSRSYFMILAVLLGIAGAVFTTELVLAISIPARDIAGAIVSSAILAYILQLFNAFRKE